MALRLRSLPGVSPSNELLAYEGITDGTCGDYVKVPCVGTRAADRCGNNEQASRISVDPAKALADISPDIFLGNFIRRYQESSS